MYPKHEDIELSFGCHISQFLQHGQYICLKRIELQWGKKPEKLWTKGNQEKKEEKEKKEKNEKEEKKEKKEKKEKTDKKNKKEKSG